MVSLLQMAKLIISTWSPLTAFQQLRFLPKHSAKSWLQVFYYLRKFLSALHNLLCEPVFFFFFCCITSLIHCKPYQWRDFYHTLVMAEFSGCIHTERSSSSWSDKISVKYSICTHELIPERITRGFLFCYFTHLWYAKAMESPILLDRFWGGGCLPLAVHVTHPEQPELPGFGTKQIYTELKPWR